MQEDLGLSTLLLLRGTVPTPEQVVIVSIDKASAEILKYDEDPEKWSRSYYAKLLNKLNQYAPSLIVFNIHFADQRDTKGDAELASAIAKRRNVILTSYIKKFSVRTAPELNVLTYERIIHPIAELEDAALGVAPFPIPRSLSTVKKFWTHKSTVGDTATLPTAVFQCYLLKQNYPAILQALKTLDPSLASSLPTTFAQLEKPLDVFHDIEMALTENGRTGQHIDKLIQDLSLSSDNKRLLQSWRSVLHYNHSLYLNYYGNVGSIKTIPLSSLLAAKKVNAETFRDKVILIGYATDVDSEKYPGFYSVFSKIGEGNTSPVEIEATAIANLIDNTWINVGPWYGRYIVVLIIAFLLLGLFRRYPYKVSMSLLALFCLAYLLMAYFVLVKYYVWLPVFIVVVEIALIALLESIFHLRTVYSVSAKYLPQNVFSRNTHNPENMDSYGELMQGVCMATDAGQYTTLSENMNPAALHVLMNKYYSVIFPAVKLHKGLISDVVGDAMLALWAKPVADKQLRIDACHAALKINAAVQDFNQIALYKLPTRLGLHYGEMRLGNVGAADHYEYRAVGDIVNTATRIEGLNKVLQTRILVSGNVIADLDGFVSREIGQFLLKGKSQAITVFELIDKGHVIDPKLAPLHQGFANALLLFKQREWTNAHKAFENLNKYYPNDGPTQFYLQYLHKNLSRLLQSQGDDARQTIIEIKPLTESWRYLEAESKAMENHMDWFG